jgi:hypothetical protein
MAIAVVALGVVGGCSKTDSTPPVATVTFAASKTQVPLGSPIDLTYTFNVSPNAKINGDYHVFVHLVNDEGQPVGKATVEIGVYKGDDRLPLIGPDPTDKGTPARSYKVATLELLPATENVFLIAKSGWHPAEFAPNNPAREWQWTQKSALLDFKNPKHDATFFLEYDGRPDAFPAPQRVSIFAGSQLVTTFPADNSAPILRRIPITAAQLGASDMVELRLEVDKTFVPAKLTGSGSDNRELGIRVYHTFVDPKAEK